MLQDIIDFLRSREVLPAVAAALTGIVALVVGIVGFRSGIKAQQKIEEVSKLIVEYKDGSKTTISLKTKDPNYEAAAQLIAALSDESLRSLTIGDRAEETSQSLSHAEDKK